VQKQARKVVVIGQGYVGLPVAMRSVEVGYDVVGIETSDHRLASLIEGTSYVEDITSVTLDAARRSGRYMASRDYSAAIGFEFAIITVPTPLKDSVPDLSFMESAAKSIGAHLTSGATVVLESTTYPGTTQELLVPLLEKTSGLRAGEDFYVGYSPERIDPGNAVWGFVETPKIVSGINSASLERVSAFYASLVDTIVPVSSPREAELTKLLENTFRHVNIALVNELAVFANALGVNIWESIDAAATKPFGFMKFTPGPGVGGHCLPVDPSYLSWQVRRKLGRNFRFVELANDVNDHMPNYVVERMMLALNKVGKALNGSNVLLLGLAYKKNTGDNREAPSNRIVELLLEFGAKVFAVDEYVQEPVWPEHVEKVSLLDAGSYDLDAVVVVTDHDGIDLSPLLGLGIPILDTKNYYQDAAVERL
jgi:UDP-N-acetyl-D-glucosamine dehydrogenase